MDVCFTPIGIIRSPYPEPVGMPIQAVAAQGVAGQIELNPIYQTGLQDIEGFSHLILLYHLHLVHESSLLVTPFLDNQPHGIFATRSPKRPNPIGLSIVRLIRVEGQTLHIEDVDIVNGTPLLDLKPYVPTFDSHEEATIGWFERNADRVYSVRADQRFL